MAIATGQDGMIEAPQALALYAKRLSEAREVCNGSGFKSFARQAAWSKRTGDDSTEEPSSDGEALAELLSAGEASEASASGEKTAVVSGESVCLCGHCSLPLGLVAYCCEGASDTFLHGECMAQHMAKTMREEEEQRRKADLELKVVRREAYDIGWKPEAIPRNADAATKLGCDVKPQGMSCLVAEGDKLRVAATLEPEGAVNLEYLSIALQVRRTEGREPLFSLDPLNEKDWEQKDNEPESAMQMKRFEPEWLAGTSVGEVMFQADYHLKELSMGEHEQPVVGMKSCLEYSDVDADDTEWSAREWFVVRKAEMRISEDNVLVPCLKMGVEAREQIAGADGLEDAPITRPDHPLVKYAEAFTHNFDLIAERKSVVSQLREVAKASIVAKYLLESGANLGENWFSVGFDSAPVCCLEVPQLWNSAGNKKISIKDGLIETSNAPKCHGIYGGVDFGIDRFRLAAPSRVATSVVAGRAVLGRPATSLMATTRTGLTMGPARQFARLSAPLSATMSMAASRAGLGAPRVAAGLSMGTPQGVDLSLENFNLSAAAEVWKGSLQHEDPRLVLGGAFLSGLCDSAPGLSEEDRSLLKAVFNPVLSDRRKEGSLFTPPPTSAAYMQRLKNLVKAEATVRQQRKEQFLSEQFSVGSPGALFPGSWTTAHVVRDGSEIRGSLRARPELKAASGVLSHALADAAPVFDRLTEDGVRYRIYRLGNLEIRTTQDVEGQEEIGMVFSTQQDRQLIHEGTAVDGSEKLVKVTEYVERSQDGNGHFFVVAETEAGSVIVIEKLADGTNRLLENPKELSDRLSLAKTIRSDECAGRQVRDLRAYQAERDAGDDAKYAQGAFSLVVGETYRTSGLRRSVNRAAPFMHLNMAKASSVVSRPRPRAA